MMPIELLTDEQLAAGWRDVGRAHKLAEEADYLANRCTARACRNDEE